MVLKDGVSTVKDGFTALREALLVALLLVLWLSPGSILGWLDDSNIDKLGILGVTVERQKKQEVSAANKLAELETSNERTATELDALKGAIAGLSATGGNAGGARLAEVQARVAQLSTTVATTGRLAKTAALQSAATIASQTKALEQLGKSVKLRGWVVAGRVDASRTNWLPGTRIITDEAPIGLAGRSTKFTTATYIRSIEPLGGGIFYSQRKVVGAVAPGETVNVEDVKASRAKNGTYFLWLLIEQR